MSVERYIGVDTERGDQVSIGTSIDRNLTVRGVLLGSDRDICFEEESTSELYTLLNTIGWLSEVEV